MDFIKKIKDRAKRIEEKMNALTENRWTRRLRITSGVTWNLFLLSIIFFFIISVFSASVGAGYFASLVAKEPLRSKTEMRSDILTYEETSEIYWANDVLLGKVNADIERTEIKLKDISPFVIDAVLATEDEYFETHPGIVPKAVFRGVIQDVTNASSQTGGSTLTQQLIKLQILTNEVSYERKAKEILLAMRLEHFMEKEEILEAYLNIIPYGRNANGDNIAGIATAAKGIFNVDAKDLNLPQAAFLSGIPQNPFAFTPFYNQGQGLKEDKHLKAGLDRMKTVLFRMKETGYITQKEYDEAIAYDITKDFAKSAPRANEVYPYVTQEIQNRTIDILTEILAKEDGIDPARLKKETKLKDKYLILAKRAMSTNGYRIHSTVNKDLYDSLNKVAKDFEHYGYTFSEEVKDPQTGLTTIVENPVQVGSIMIENNTGKILSFVGGRDFGLENTNHATQALRQNGSSMKPLAVFAPAIEYGVIGAGSPVVDVKFDGPWRIANYIASQELGIIPARQALATSQNLATARLYNDIINRRPLDFVKKMGFSNIEEMDYSIQSISLGTKETTVEENTNAYATFANGGKFVDAYMIEKIEDAEGNIIYQHKVEPVDVFSPQTSYIISDMMRDVTKYGTATIMRSNLNFGVDIAAKTGTTNNYADAWLVGYNPNVSLGVWLGYRDLKKGLNDVRGGYIEPNNRVNILFARLMNAANATTPEIVGAKDTFQRPEGVVTRSFCSISGFAPSKSCSAAGLVKSDLFNANVFLPNKVDDSMISGSYVSVKGTKYLALPNTPSEFIVKGGSGVNQSFIQRMLGPWKGDPSKLFPGNSGVSSGGSIGAGSAFNADNVAPAAVKATLNGSTMTWTNSGSNDVVGYYIYQGNAKVGTVRDGQANAFNIGKGSYTVRAVDITGRQSASSNAIKGGEKADNEATKQKTDDAKAKAEKAKKEQADKEKQAKEKAPEKPAVKEPKEDEPKAETPKTDEKEEPEKVEDKKEEPPINNEPEKNAGKDNNKNDGPSKEPTPEKDNNGAGSTGTTPPPPEPTSDKEKE